MLYRLDLTGQTRTFVAVSPVRYLGLFSTFFAVTCLGCVAEEEIRHYQALRLEESKPAVRTQSVRGDRRLLAAVVPYGDRTWFFKLVGPTDAVAEHAERFDQFIRSLRFGADRPVSWEVPQGWIEQAGTRSRFATFQVGSEERPMELSVIPLGREAGSLLANVNRWRRNDLGLTDEMSETELGGITREVQLDGTQATIVDIVARAGLPAGHPPVSTSGSEGSQQRPVVQYTVPTGWKEIASRSAFRVASFEVIAGGQRADVSISPLAGTAGGLLANVNRWRREQLGLPVIDEAELRRSLHTIDVAGTAAQYVELVGPESAGPERQSILGVILQRADQTWFFKMTGPADLVAQQKSAFEEFVRSIKFE
jgi:hypothetical protein